MTTTTCKHGHDREPGARCKTCAVISSRLSRAKRAAQAAGDKATRELMAAFYAKRLWDDRPYQFLFYAARRFADYHGTDAYSAAYFVLRYFETTDYQPTTNPREIVSITLRAAS